MGIYGDLLKLNDDKKLIPPQTEESAAPSPTPDKSSAPKKPTKPQSSKRDTVQPRQPSNRDTVTPRNRGSTVSRNHETMVSRYHDTTVEVIRSAVKLFGKEAATYRFTAEEKKALSDLVYTYKTQGIRTSENEITRISVNFIMADYKENGENSILHKALKALNS